MEFFRSIHAIDAHAMGEPARIVVSGVTIAGRTMAERMRYVQEKLDGIRRGLMLEPRGHRDMFGAVLTPAEHADSAFGIVFMDGDGFNAMCGHGTIAACTVAVETGMVAVDEPATEIRLDTAVGQIVAQVRVENGKAKSVSFENVPAFLCRRDVAVELEGVGTVRVDLAYGGNLVALCRADQLGAEIAPANIPLLSGRATRLRERLNEDLDLAHPETGEALQVGLVELVGPPRAEGADLQNMVVFGRGQIDRSPCGVGSSAKVAAMVAAGELALGEPVVIESVIGTRLTAEPLREAWVGDRPAVVPRITGSAYITAFSQFVFDRDDPTIHGFVV